MSYQEKKWWMFLETWSLAITNKSVDQLDIRKLIDDFKLDENLVYEFINFFHDDFPQDKDPNLTICMGARCRAKGNERIFSLLIDANKVKVPELQLLIKPVLCLQECDKAPCSLDGLKLRCGNDSSWVERFIKE